MASLKPLKSAFLAFVSQVTEAHPSLPGKGSRTAGKGPPAWEKRVRAPATRRGATPTVAVPVAATEDEVCGKGKQPVLIPRYTSSPPGKRQPRGPAPELGPRCLIALDRFPALPPQNFLLVIFFEPVLTFGIRSGRRDGPGSLRSGWGGGTGVCTGWARDWRQGSTGMGFDAFVKGVGRRAR